jgi:hypothetical protein
MRSQEEALATTPELDTGGNLLWRPLPEEACGLGESAGHGERRRVGQVALERAG